MRKNHWFFFAIFSLLLASCRQTFEVSTIPTGYYLLDNNTDSVLKTENTAFIEDNTDTLQITFVKDTIPLSTINYSLQDKAPVQLQVHGFDADIFTVPFKVRPAAGGIPAQLDANFHIAFYAGRRHDFYALSSRRAPNGKHYRNTKKASFGYGLFVGMAAANIRPEFMNGKINYEYDGFTANAGIAGIFDVGAVNLGIALGVDKLLDKNHRNWIYQHKPWVGVLLGFNLN